MDLAFSEIVENEEPLDDVDNEDDQPLQLFPTHRDDSKDDVHTFAQTKKFEKPYQDNLPK